MWAARGGCCACRPPCVVLRCARTPELPSAAGTTRRGLLIIGCFSMVCVLIGLIGSLRVACCLSVYLVLGGALTLGARSTLWWRLVLRGCCSVHSPARLLLRRLRGACQGAARATAANSHGCPLFLTPAQPS